MNNEKGNAIAVFVALYSVLSIYAFPFLINNLGVAVLYFIVLPLLVIESSKGRIPNVVKSQKVLMIYVIYLSIVTVFTSATLSKSLISLVLSSTIYVFLFSYKGFHSFLIRLYLWLSGIFSGFLILQYAAFFLAGIEISGIVGFLPLYEDFDTKGIIETMTYIRLSSVFREPSHFALYVVPSIVIALKSKTIKKRFRYCILIIVTIATILSTSGNGIILLAMSYCIYAFDLFIEKRTIKNFFIVVMIMVVGVAFYSTSEFLASTTEFLFVGNGNNVGSKADYRVYRGFQLFYDMSFENKITGVGWKNAEMFFKSQNSLIYGNYSSNATFDYFNSIAGILIYSGFIGAFLFWGFIRSLWKECFTSTSRILIIILLASMISSSVFMTDQWLLYLALIYATSIDINSFIKKS